MAKEVAPKRQALGRGIEALIRDERPAEGALRIVQIPLVKIAPNRYQPRHDFDEAALAELAQSIKENGVIQPVTVRRTSSGYEMVIGERRLKAAIMAGLETIPAMVKDVPDDSLLPLALVENVQREDLDPIERAEAYRALTLQFGLTQEQLASRVGLDRATIANTMRLLKLPQAVQRYISDGRITMGHAKALLSMSSPEAQKTLAERIINRGLSVREAEKLAAGPQRRPTGTAPAGTASRDVHIEAIEEALQRVLGTRVRIIQKRDEKGKIEIEFYGSDDLDRILEILQVS